MKRFFVAALLLSIFGATGTKADSKSGTINNPKQIPDSIIISANKFPTNVEKNASSITVITEDEIQKSQTLLVSELLKKVPGLDVVRTGGVGGQTSVFMRGTNSNHTLVIIDGVEMNNPSSPTTSFDFGSLNVSNIQRIEILRGPQSVLYGSDAVGGLIQIFTKRGFGDLRTEIIAEAGSFNSFNESIQLSGSQNKIDYSLFLSRKDTDGFSSISEDAGGVEKDGFESTDIIANIGIQLFENYELTINGRNSDATTDIDGTFGILDDPNNISENKVKSLSLRVKSFDNKSNFFNPEISFSLSDQELNSTNDVDADHPFSSSKFNSNGKRMKIAASNFMNIYENVNTIIGVEYEEEKYNSARVSSYFDFWTNSIATSYDTVAEVSASTFSLYGLDDWAVNEKFSVSGGLRYDDHEDFGSQVTYRFTSLYQFSAKGLTFKATYGTAFKAPSLFQLNDSNYGNPNLQPEENRGWELGFDKSSPDNILKFGATYFSNKIENLVDLDAAYRPININEASSNGVEAYTQINVQNSSMRIDVTYTDLKDKTNNTNLIRRPKEKISLKLNLQFSKDFAASLFVNTVGNRFDTDFNSWSFEEVVLEGYTVLNLTTSYQLLDKVLLTGRVDNLFDEKYRDVLTYNTAERSGYVGLKISL